jgi:hypothetical protein
MMGLLSTSPSRKILMLLTVKMMGLLSKSPSRKTLMLLTVKMTQLRTLALRT